MWQLANIHNMLDVGLSEGSAKCEIGLDFRREPTEATQRPVWTTNGSQAIKRKKKKRWMGVAYSFDFKRTISNISVVIRELHSDTNNCQALNS